jgi:putative membrane protein
VGSRMLRLALPAIASVAAVVVAVAAAVFLVELGRLSAHMVVHIAVMNIAAPLAAVALMHRPFINTGRSAPLWIAGALQIMLLWAWHAPSAQRATMDSATLQIVMHGSMLVAALCFWALLLSASTRWQAIFLLLATGKLSCLLGALLIFAPRILYTGAHRHSTMADLSDQQLAGLLMIAACPLSYLTAGFVLAAQMLADLGSTSGSPDGRKLSLVR